MGGSCRDVSGGIHNDQLSQNVSGEIIKNSAWTCLKVTDERERRQIRSADKLSDRSVGLISSLQV